MKILITGAGGQLGSELQVLSKARTYDHWIFVDREELDISDRDKTTAFFSHHKPDYCINAAAYTNVEKAEEEKEMAQMVNVIGAENIARSCAENNTTLFHISTDFIFDGKKTVPLIEDDEPHPLGVYGQTKYEAENVVQKQCPKNFIVRTSWLYSSFGHNFVKTIFRLSKERDSLDIVADQYGSPTYARDLAAALVCMIDSCEEKKIKSGVIPQELFGIYHYANDGEVTWFEFAQKIVEIAELSCIVKPICAEDYPSRVKRPAYSVLSSKKIQLVFPVIVPEWDESVAACMALLMKEPH